MRYSVEDEFHLKICPGETKIAGIPYETCPKPTVFSEDRQATRRSASSRSKASSAPGLRCGVGS